MLSSTNVFHPLHKPIEYPLLSIEIHCCLPVLLSVLTLLANESASGIGHRHRATTRVAPTMLRLRKPVRAWWQRNVSFPSLGHFTLCVIRQQSQR